MGIACSQTALLRLSRAAESNCASRAGPPIPGVIHLCSRVPAACNVPPPLTDLSMSSRLRVGKPGRHGAAVCVMIHWRFTARCTLFAADGSCFTATHGA